MLEFIGPILGIVVVDLVLSGDNAVVIGMAARRLSPANRRKAIVFGGAGAIGLRIIFTLMAAYLLGVPFLKFVGGVLLLYIAYKLVRPNDHEEHVSEAESLGQAVRTIILADVVMSLDNILAVGGVAQGHYGLLLFGLLLSIPILLVGSELVARLLGRVPALLYVGVFVLLHAAVLMIVEDPLVHARVQLPDWFPWPVAAALTALLWAMTARQERQATAARQRAAVAAASDGHPVPERHSHTSDPASAA